MTPDLSATLTRIKSKTHVLVEKYRAVVAKNEALEREVEELRQEVANRKRAQEQLTLDNEYLSMARSVAPDAAMAGEFHEIVSKLVRDIDSCISGLND